VCKGFLVLKGLLVRKVSMGLKVCKAHKVTQVHKEMLGLMATWVCKARLGCKATSDRKDSVEHRAGKVSAATPDRKGFLAPKVCRARWARRPCFWRTTMVLPLPQRCCRCPLEHRWAPCTTPQTATSTI